MKNRYLFYQIENFDDIALNDYTRNDIKIPKTDVHIYEFMCKDNEKITSDEDKAKALDALTEILRDKLDGKFQIVESESSQYFCGKLYPLVVKFETKLRYALYIARALCNDGTLNNQSFLLEVLDNGKKKNHAIEELDFSQIYTSVFTDTTLQAEANKKYDMPLTKSEWIKRIEAIPEKTIWQDWVGSQYNYIKNNFLRIKDFRNDVMHSHLITYENYIDAKNTLIKAINEIERVITDKLIVNNSEYANKANIWEILSAKVKGIQTLGEVIEKVSSPEAIDGMEKALSMLIRPLVVHEYDSEDRLPGNNQQQLPEPEKENDSKAVIVKEEDQGNG